MADMKGLAMNKQKHKHAQNRPRRRRYALSVLHHGFAIVAEAAVALAVFVGFIWDLIGALFTAMSWDMPGFLIAMIAWSKKILAEGSQLLTKISDGEFPPLEILAGFAILVVVLGLLRKLVGHTLKNLNKQRHTGGKPKQGQPRRRREQHA